MKTLSRLMFAAFILFALFVLYLALKPPKNTANWQPQYKVLPSIRMKGDKISILNIRDFTYNNDGSINKAHYLNQDYLLSDFKQAWYGISHFSKNNLAHVFISFEFKNDQFLIVSIEARLEEKHINGYNLIKGAFRAFNKAVVLATERDAIGLRTHIRKERVHYINS